MQSLHGPTAYPLTSQSPYNGDNSSATAFRASGSAFTRGMASAVAWARGGEGRSVVSLCQCRTTDAWQLSVQLIHEHCHFRRAGFQP